MSDSPDWNTVPFRQLEDGEIISEFDWVEVSSNWNDPPRWQRTRCAGQAAPDPKYPAHRIYRRLL